MLNSWEPRSVLRLAILLAATSGGFGSIAVAQDDDDLDLDSLFGDEASGSSNSSGASDAGSDQSSQEAAADSSGSARTIRLPAEPQPSLPPAPPKRAAHLEEIVVTARKREESIQEIPLSVTPFNAEELERRGFTGLDDIAAATPGFTFEAFQSGGAHGNAVIRGLAQQFTTSRIQNVSFFIDGVYLQRQSMLDLGMIDMQRIEVVKGPQNALYGRNAFAGAVNYITLRPGSQPEGYGMVTLGDNGREQYRVGVSGPLGESDQWFGKFTLGTSRYDGHTQNDHPVANANPPGDNVRGMLGGHDDLTYSVSLAYDPIPELRTRASFYRSELVHETGAGYGISGVNAARFGFRLEDQNDLNCNTATVPDIGIPSPQYNRTGFTLWCGELPAYASDAAERTVDGIVVDPRAVGFRGQTSVVTLSADYDFYDNLTGYYLYGQARHDSFTDGGTSDEDPLAGRGILTNAAVYTLDTNNTAAYEFANTASSRPNSELQSFSHEVRFDWEPMPRLRTSAGLYYSVVEDQEWTAIFVNDLCNADTPQNIENCNRALQHPNTLAERTVLTVGTAYDLYTRQHGGFVRGEWSAFKDSITAAFLSGSYDFTDRIEGTLEARISKEDKEIERFTDSFALRFGETVTYNPPEDPVIPGLANSIESSLVVPFDEKSITYFTPRAILNWQFLDDSMVYASVAKGVKSGGFNNADDPEDLEYEEASNWTYEIGSKNKLFGGLLTVNGAVYFIDWSGLQGGVPPSNPGASTSDIITNIGGASSTGIELESSVFLPFGFSADLGFTYNDATYDEDVIYSGGVQDTGSFHCDGVTCPADGSVGGNQLARTSKLQGSLGLNYFTSAFGWDMNARIDTNYQSKQFLTPLNLGWVPERQITNFSFNATSPSQTWEVTAWVKNLTDEDYPANSFVLGVFNQYLVGKGPRRTFGGTLKFKF